MVELGIQSGNSFSFASGTNADGSVVVGGSQGGAPDQAFRWTATTGMVGLGFLPNGGDSYAHGVNADGSVLVGQASDSTGHTQAFRWTAPTKMIGLGFLPGDTFSNAAGVNGDGTVIVGNSANVKCNSLSRPSLSLDRSNRHGCGSGFCPEPPLVRHMGTAQTARSLLDLPSMIPHMKPADKPSVGLQTLECSQFKRS